MDFYEVLERVLELLQRHRRVSYRALKVQFELDDDRLDLLKEELLYAQYPIADDNGRGLIWTGAPGGVQAPAPPQSTQLPAAQQDQPTQAEQPTEHRSPEAERRQLTVMFCDLVDSTKLSRHLDPEEYRDVVRAYQRVCTDVIQRYDGHIAQLLGDGLLVYFGYPQAHEDDPQRAVHTGLDIIDAVGTLNTQLEQDKGIRLAVRVGIHTGLVVVGQMGSQGRQEQLALGEVPNIASRIEGLAAANTVVISEASYRLVQGYFSCEALGAQTLRGVAEPVHVYRVLQDSGARGRLDVATTRGLTPLVGRESEVTLLLERWEQAKAGQGHVVLLSGEGGIGKSRLVQTLKDHVADEPHVRWECRSVPYYQNTALYPLTDLFQRTLQWQHDEPPDEKLGQLEQVLGQYRLLLEESVPLFAPLLSLALPEDRYLPLNLSPQRQRQQTLEAFVAILLELAEHQPVLFIIEDLHWTDPSTLELLNLVIEQTPTASLLTLLTCRPHFQPAWHHRSYLTEITVNRLSHTQVAQLVTRIIDGRTFPPDVLQQILEKTDGVPLFVEEITKAIVESGHLQDVKGHYELTGSFHALTIPATLQDSLTARLDRLVTAKAVAQYAAVIGRQFTYPLLQAVSQVDEAILQRELGRLVEAELVYQRGVPPQAHYFFKHALIQDAAYESLLRSTRQQYHQRIAQVLETQFPETAETQPELLAHHYTKAGLTEKAVYYWLHAGQRASGRSAYVEAISHLRTGLALLQTLPETLERVQSEIDIYIALGASLTTIKGYAASEVEQNYARARQLCQHLKDPQRLFSIQYGLGIYYIVRAEHQTAQALCEQLLTFAHQVQDATMLMAAHQMLGTTCFFMGAVAAAHTHYTQGITHYHARQHHSSAFLDGADDGVTCLSRAAWVLWYLGYPDQALQRSQKMLTLAREMVHPYTLAWALNGASWTHWYRREGQVAYSLADEAITLSTAHDFPHWLAMGQWMRGQALIELGQEEEGTTQLQEGLRAYQATGALIGTRGCGLAEVARGFGQQGQIEEGLRKVAEALEGLNQVRHYEAEMYRLKGQLTLEARGGRLEISSPSPQAPSLKPLVSPAVAQEVEGYFLKAIEVAQKQQAKSWELRAATSLARLWQQQGKRAEAHALLSEIYGWFTEGFDTKDLQEAKALLEELT